MKVWCQEMPLEYFQNLSNFMPKHLQMVIKKKENNDKIFNYMFCLIKC